MVVISHWRCPLTIRTYALLHVVGIFTTTVPGFDRYEYLDTCLRLHISKTLITSSEVAAVPLTRKTRPTKIWGQLLLDLFETKNEHNQNSFFCTFVELSLISQNTCSRLCTKSTISPSRAAWKNTWWSGNTGTPWFFFANGWDPGWLHPSHNHDQGDAYDQVGPHGAHDPRVGEGFNMYPLVI